MNEERKPVAELISEMYDQHADLYATSAEKGFSWRYIERPAMYRYLKDIVEPTSRVLDLGTGTGRVIQLLKDLGVNEENITGLDISEELIKIARLKFPRVTFLHASADNFSLPPESFDLVTANMVFQYLDNDMLKRAMDTIYDVLKLDGQLVFIEPHGLRSEQVRKGVNNNQWIREQTPWGQKVYVFNRNPWDLLDIHDFCGFLHVDGWRTLPVDEAGRVEQVEFERYSAMRYARMGYVWKKMSEERKRLMNEYAQHTLRV
ncbi:methyltransferase domain-containing protein [Candidatus Microgenomates bacterium]|nr:methyltransferase domain-containing protein [Candidatus Microgenomates bacterium]